MALYLRSAVSDKQVEMQLTIDCFETGGDKQLTVNQETVRCTRKDEKKSLTNIYLDGSSI
jgi:hypothetical protein